MNQQLLRDRQSRVEILPLLGIALAIALLHLLTNSRYGFHRDELQVMSDSLHMDWGFVPYPPVDPFLAHIGMKLFGLSLVGLRLFSVIAQCLVIVVSGFMAYELGGGRLAQITTAIAVALSPLALFEGTEFQYTTYDHLWWVLIAYFSIRLLKSDDPRWCTAIGAAIGLGLQTKYTISFLICGVVAGIVLTSARRFLLSIWFWAGIALALLIFLPNLLWQVHHGFISYHFLQHIHARDVGQGRANGFISDQFLICTNLIAAPLWIAGLIFYLRDRRNRMLAWMYLVPLVLFIVGKGRGYYLGGAYPMLIAMGAVAGEHWLGSLQPLRRKIAESAFLTLLIANGIFISTFIIPLTAGGPLQRFALEKNGDLREEIGWDDLVKEIASVRDGLTSEQQKDFGVVVGNYGEQGAVEILGPAYRLPAPISGTNSAWIRGYPTPPPSILIVVGSSKDYAERTFTNCRLAGHNDNRMGIHNEESSDHPDIFVCGSPAKPWPQFWVDYQDFG